ncbi:protein CYCLOPS-like isoform X2 [Euphorbia lathyris]|uniref:protein CYCLOPS-like isoform X2 n=1 Tax=Euphorbia lathyris TaxID=212925 RepID=UPI003313192A
MIEVGVGVGVGGEEKMGEAGGGGKGYSEMYRNTSEDMFLKSLMENSVSMPVPTMEMLGFKNISSHLLHHHHNFRIDSEELFKTWLTNGENHDCNSASIAHRTRQASKRISTELANTPAALQKKRSNDVIYTQNDYPVADTPSSHLNHRNSIEITAQATNLYLAKAWFHTSQPMTRSRSSELRKRYAAMQSAQTSSGNGPSNLRQGFADPIDDIGNQTGSEFMSILNPAPQMGDVDRVSSVVSMLKGTLERKKLGNQFEQQNTAIYHDQAQPQQVVINYDQEKAQTSQEISSTHVNDAEMMDLVGFVNPTMSNPIHQLSTFSREASQSESSAAAPVLSSGFDACDGPSISSMSDKPVENNKTPEKGPQPKDFRERIIENLKDDRKRGGLVRYGSVTSTGSVEKGDPTKKRRVERSRNLGIPVASFLQPS